MRILTRYRIKITEYDSSGYYYPTYISELSVIADSKEDAIKKAFERITRQKPSWAIKAKVITSEDIIIEDKGETK